MSEDTEGVIESLVPPELARSYATLLTVARRPDWFLCLLRHQK